MVGGPALAAGGATATDHQNNLVSALRNSDGLLDPRQVVVAIRERDVVAIPIAFFGEPDTLGCHDANPITHFALDAVENTNAVRRYVGIATELNNSRIGAD